MVFYIFLKLLSITKSNVNQRCKFILYLYICIIICILMEYQTFSINFKKLS